MAIIGFVIILLSVTVSIVAEVLQELLGRALEFKSENDLIV
ncbi:DUF2975 domain-containing protein [Bacillus sp. Marseille-Q1617]|nr:DUF2975 domain-containing protein [Bacillus sp. Marseille-Q1617]